MALRVVCFSTKMHKQSLFLQQSTVSLSSRTTAAQHGRSPSAYKPPMYVHTAETKKNNKTKDNTTKGNHQSYCLAGTPLTSPLAAPVQGDPSPLAPRRAARRRAHVSDPHRLCCFVKRNVAGDGLLKEGKGNV